MRVVVGRVVVGVAARRVLTAMAAMGPDSWPDHRDAAPVVLAHWKVAAVSRQSRDVTRPRLIDMRVHTSRLPAGRIMPISAAHVSTVP
jgi:hypothetical protein